MQHLLVKFGDTPAQEYRPGDWHLVSSLPMGDKTACGLSHEVAPGSKKIERYKGGVTCPKCLEVINYYKSIKL